MKLRYRARADVTGQVVFTMALKPEKESMPLRLSSLTSWHLEVGWHARRNRRERPCLCTNCA
jgi:hypothetical protein